MHRRREPPWPLRVSPVKVGAQSPAEKLVTVFTTWRIPNKTTRQMWRAEDASVGDFWSHPPPGVRCVESQAVVAASCAASNNYTIFEYMNIFIQ